MTNEEIQEAAEKAWDEDAKNNPNPVNPYAFVYGFKVAAGQMFTKEDMIAFAEFHNAAWYEIPAELNFETWLKERKKK